MKRQICVFDNEYTDRTYQDSTSGDLTFDIADNKVIYNKNINIELSEGDRMTISTMGFYALVANNAVVENDRIISDEEKILSFHDGMEVYADTVGESGLVINTKYYVRDVDNGTCSYTLEDESGNKVSIASGGFNLYKAISNIELCLARLKSRAVILKAER